jgi:hypothetical protein
MRRLPRALDEQKGPIEPPDAPSNRRAVPDLATKYSRTAEFDLGIDLHEDNPLSNSVSKLLDVAYKLQVQLSVANEDISSLKNTIQTLETKGKAPEDDLPRSLYPLVLLAVATELMNRIGPQARNISHPTRSQIGPPVFNTKCCTKSSVIKKLTTINRGYSLTFLYGKGWS